MGLDPVCWLVWPFTCSDFTVLIQRSINQQDYNLHHTNSSTVPSQSILPQHSLHKQNRFPKCPASPQPRGITMTWRNGHIASAPFQPPTYLSLAPPKTDKQATFPTYVEMHAENSIARVRLSSRIGQSHPLWRALADRPKPSQQCQRQVAADIAGDSRRRRRVCVILGSWGFWPLGWLEGR